jgi:hypothetical protein
MERKWVAMVTVIKRRIECVATSVYVMIYS